jgi:hypothetical protein
MKRVADHIHRYTYATVDVTVSPVSTREWEDLKVSVGFTDEDQRYANRR